MLYQPGKAIKASERLAISAFLWCMSATAFTSPTVSPVSCNQMNESKLSLKQVHRNVKWKQLLRVREREREGERVAMPQYNSILQQCMPRKMRKLGRGSSAMMSAAVLPEKWAQMEIIWPPFCSSGEATNKGQNRERDNPPKSLTFSMIPISHKTRNVMRI